MSNYTAKRYRIDKRTAMGQADVRAGAYDDVIDLSLGDPDMITDDRVIDMAAADAHRGYTKYTDPKGDPELRDEIRRFYKEEYDMDVRDEEVFISTSANVGMYLALEAVIDDGDEVILPAPFYTPYLQQVELVRGVPVELPTYEEDDFQIDTDRLEGMITNRTKAVILNSPNNPTGSTMTVETMGRIAGIVRKHDLVVITDDIYTAFSFQTLFIPFASLPGMREHTIILNSFSKNYTMTGWRVGNIIAPDYIVDLIGQINENVVYTAPSISQRAAIYALRLRNEIQPTMVEEYRKRVFYAAERVNRIPWMHVIYPPKGTFYLFVNIKKSELTSAEAVALIFREAHVLTLPGNGFGDCGEGYLRIACTVGVDKLGEAFDRIEKIRIPPRA